MIRAESDQDHMADDLRRIADLLDWLNGPAGAVGPDEDNTIELFVADVCLGEMRCIRDDDTSNWVYVPGDRLQTKEPGADTGG